jgi:hypothetical protein
MNRKSTLVTYSVYVIGFTGVATLILWTLFFRT